MLRMLGRNKTTDRPSIFVGITIADALHLIRNPRTTMVIDFSDLGENVEVALLVADTEDELEAIGNEAPKQEVATDEETRQ